MSRKFEWVRAAGKILRPHGFQVFENGEEMDVRKDGYLVTVFRPGFHSIQDVYALLDESYYNAEGELVPYRSTDEEKEGKGQKR